MARSSGGHLAHLRARCTALRDSLAARGRATPEELAAAWPGGGENPARTLDGWIECAMQYARFSGRAEAQPSASSADEAETALAQSRLDVPHPVVFADGVTRAVHPKGVHALEWLNSLDRQYVGMMSAAAALLDDGAPEDTVVLAPLLESLAIRLWAWVLTSPGAGLPFEDSGEAPEPPAFTSAMTVDDVVALYLAHVQVHGRRLQLMGGLFPTTPGAAASRATLAGFVGSYANEQGLYGPDVLRRWSVGAVYAQALDGLRAHAEAERRAKARPKGPQGSQG